MLPNRARPTPSDAHRGSAHHLALSGATQGHAVQFYDDEEYLHVAVAEFLAAGLAIGQTCLAIATPLRSEALRTRLAADGFDVDGALADGRLAFADARQLATLLTANGLPTEERFDEHVGGLVRGAARRATEPVLRLYGEMVDVLWKDGRVEAALRVESLWNELAERQPMSLLCAYSMGNFYRADDADRFLDVCAHHTRVVPAESYSHTDEARRMVEIGVLQQRARALEAELAHRTELERRLRDALTERQQVEESLERKRSELETLLQEREELLARERSARADAVAANRAKSEFLAVMSHELRTPLNAIAGHVQLVALGIHGPVSDAQQHALERVQRSQRHLLALINDVLNLSRIETGRVEYTIEDVPLAPLLDDVVAAIEPLLAARQLTCRACLTPAAATAVRGDREKLEQILLNLITNAIKFTPAGGNIVAEADGPGEDGLARVHVRDNGIGIPADKVEAIFEPFVQLGRSTTRPGEGAGLGLAISRDLAQGMGGRLSVSSVVGEGTTFTLSVPLA